MKLNIFIVYMKYLDREMFSYNFTGCVSEIIVIFIFYLLFRILVATPSNSSADLICERLIGWNLSSMVPGNLTRLVGYNYMIDSRMSSIVKSYASVIDLNLSDSERSHCDADGKNFFER